jgi:GDP-4-dehydro-6-deoxy-D-mannose reductase
MTYDRVLVTGATGFVGAWTLRHLRESHPVTELWATSERPDPGGLACDHYRKVDLRDRGAVRALVGESRPTGVVHLASLIGGADLDLYLDVNVVGTARLYGALSAAGLTDTRIVQVGSAAMYGVIGDGDLPVPEKQPLRPVTAYAVSKVAQEYVALSMSAGSGLPIALARIFNLLGPGQPEGLVPMTFVRQLAGVREGGADRLNVGLVTARRDFVDVRDAVGALDAILERGEVGSVYNVASGRDVSVREVIDELLSVAGVDVPVEIEDARLREIDVPVMRADISKIKELGWEPRIGLRESLESMWAEAVGEGA